jgi:hypothetical protein
MNDARLPVTQVFARSILGAINVSTNFFPGYRSIPDFFSILFDQNRPVPVVAPRRRLFSHDLENRKVCSHTPSKHGETSQGEFLPDGLSGHDCPLRDR